MLRKETIVVHSENHMKYINVFCEQNIDCIKASALS